MHIKKRTIYLLIAVVAVIFTWWIWSATSRPNYQVVTEKPTYGNPASRIKIIEFGDIQCPACKAAEASVEQIKAAYKDRIQFTYLHFPLTNLHRYAQPAAEAAECANDFGKYYEYIKEAYTISPDLSRASLISAAERLGIPTTNFTACLDSGWKASFVSMDFREGEKMGVQGTPSFYVNGKLVPDWSFGAFSSIIDAELTKTATPPANMTA